MKHARTTITELFAMHQSGDPFVRHSSEYDMSFNQLQTEIITLTLRVLPHSVQPCGVVYLRVSMNNEKTPLTIFLLNLLTFNFLIACNTIQLSCF